MEITDLITRMQNNSQKKMLPEIRQARHEQNETFNKEIDNIKTTTTLKRLKLKNITIKLKKENSIEGFQN